VKPLRREFLSEMVCNPEMLAITPVGLASGIAAMICAYTRASLILSQSFLIHTSNFTVQHRESHIRSQAFSNNKKLKC
jgi:hypothetical protein